MPIVRSSSDLQRNISEIYDLCRDTREPVYITRNGGASLVVMDAEEFDARMDFQQRVFAREMRAYRGIMRGYEDAEAGRLTPLAQVREELRDAR